MAKRALILRSNHDALDGFPASAACIEQVLTSPGYGFELTRCEGSDATRAGILGACRALISIAEPGDAIVIYYVGHGGLITNSQYIPEGELPRHIQFLCPSDYAATDDEFHGITALELSGLLAQLTARTRNVTVILECCFASQMMRIVPDADVRPSIPRITRLGLIDHFATVRGQLEGAAIHTGDNPHAVRVLASGQTTPAYQILLPDSEQLQAAGLSLPPGTWIGAMTFRLAEILMRTAGAQVSWRSIVAELRARMVIQRPEIEGPDTRVPFTLATVARAAIAVRSEGPIAQLAGGRILGVSIGDVYGVVLPEPPDRKTHEPPETIVIEEIAAATARGRRVGWCADTPELSEAAVAIPISRAAERMAVRVVGPEVARTAVHARLCDSERLRPMRDSDRTAIAAIHVEGSTFQLRDEIGPLGAPAPYPDGLVDALREVERLATAHRLRALDEHQGISPDDVAIDLLAINPLGRRRLADSGEAVGLRDRLAIQITSRTDEPRYANVFGIGTRKHIMLISVHASGIRLVRDRPAYVGDTIDGRLPGLGLTWPEDLARDAPRLDSVLVVITDAPVDLRALETSDRQGRKALTGRLAQIVASRPRASGRRDDIFALSWRDYWLFPLDASLDFGAPHVDAGLYGSLPPGAGLHGRVIQLRDLRAPGFRIDVLICARLSDTPIRATTISEEVCDEHELWRGHAAAGLDVYVWTSARSEDRRSLSELLARSPATAAIARLRARVEDPLIPGASLELAARARAALVAAGLVPTTAFRGAFADDSAPVRYTAGAVAFTLSVAR